MSKTRFFQKANAYAEAWRRVFGVHPTLRNVALGLAVAQHETRCGDAWPGEFNWGAVQSRSLNAEEKAALASIPPSLATVPAAREALAAAGLTNPTGALHIDTSPGKGAYWVYFAAFGNDEAGAEHFIKVLAKNRPSCRAVLTDPIGTPYALADRMYASRYYEGFHVKDAWYDLRDGKWRKTTDPSPAAKKGADLNVESYARALTLLSKTITTALLGWEVGADAPAAQYALDTVLGQQRALNRLLSLRERLVEDGIRGPKTILSIKMFQAQRGLIADGIVGPKTTAAFEAALGVL